MDSTTNRSGTAPRMVPLLAIAFAALVVVTAPALGGQPHKAGQLHKSAAPAKATRPPAVSSHRAGDANGRTDRNGSGTVPPGHALSGSDDRARHPQGVGVRRSAIGRHRNGSSRVAINSVPAVPTSVTTVANANGSVTVQWNTSSVNRSAGDVFEIGRRLPGESDFTKIGETSGGSFTDRGLSTGAATGDVEYQVVARRNGRYSGMSGVVSVTPAPTGTPVQAGGAGKGVRSSKAGGAKNQSRKP